MELNNSFEVAADPASVWELFLDVERVVPCMPGAELTETVADGSYEGKVTVRLGPVAMTYKGSVVITERDEASRRVVLEAKGMETRGKGTAAATVTTRIHPSEGGTRVDIVTDLTLSGAAVQYGRGMVGDVSQRLTGEFADCLRQHFAAPRPEVEVAAGGSPPASAAPAPTARPIKVFRLALWTVWRALVRGVKRVFGRSQAPSGD